MSREPSPCHLSPDQEIFKGDVVKITLRGEGGDLAILAGHVPFITPIKTGDVNILLVDETIKTGHTVGGLLTVDKKNTSLLTGIFTWK